MFTETNTSTQDQDTTTEVVIVNAEIQGYLDKLKKHEQLQETFKAINKAYKLFKKNASTLDLNKELSEKSKELIRTWIPRYSFETTPIATYQLTNNNATIKNTKDRIAQLQAKAKKEAETGGENAEYPFNGGKVVINYADDRVQIFYDEKPNAEKISDLKGRGFKWSYTNEAWQRMITNNTLWNVEYLTGATIPKMK